MKDFNQELIQDTFDGIIDKFKWSAGVDVEESDLKSCALIVVEEIISVLKSCNSVESRILTMHYESVKKLINARLQ